MEKQAEAMLNLLPFHRVTRKSSTSFSLTLSKSVVDIGSKRMLLASFSPGPRTISSYKRESASQISSYPIGTVSTPLDTNKYNLGSHSYRVSPMLITQPAQALHIIPVSKMNCRDSPIRNKKLNAFGMSVCHLSPQSISEKDWISGFGNRLTNVRISREKSKSRLLFRRGCPPCLLSKGMDVSSLG